jgi:large subunit ribosomal protein L19
MDLLKKVAQTHLRTASLGDFEVGDTVDVHTRIKEGDKERIQIFNGTVISRRGGHGEVNDAFTVRRVVAGEGVERIFPEHSPRLVKVEVVRRGRVRRAKLYYLRKRVGKSTKVRELLAGMEGEESADGTTAVAAPPAKA